MSNNITTNQTKPREGFQILNNGTQYRTTEAGYILIKGKREIYISARSVEAGEKARNLIANFSFNQIFLKAKRVPLFTHNQRGMWLN